VLTVLPDAVRDELNQKLIAGEFSDYRGLESWLLAKGFQISRGSLQRYGSKFERRIKTVAMATSQAHALAEASPDREGAMTAALVRLVQEKMFTVLVEAEGKIEDGQLPRIARAIADLGRATISQKKWAEEMRDRLDNEKRRAGQKLDEVKHAGGLTEEAYEAMRNALFDINPFGTHGMSPHGPTRSARRRWHAGSSTSRSCCSGASRAP